MSSKTKSLIYSTLAKSGFIRGSGSIEEYEEAKKFIYNYEHFNLLPLDDIMRHVTKYFKV